MDDEQKGAGEVIFGLKRKFDNLWYHYKFAILAGIAVLAIIIFTVVQCAAKTPGDADIAYVGPKGFTIEDYNELQNNFDEILGEDLNGDNKVYVDFTNFLYMTQNQIDDARAAGEVVDMQTITVSQSQISLDLVSGSIIIYFIDPQSYKQYQKISGVDAFMPLQDALGYTPSNSYDEFAMRLKDLVCWDYFAGINSFPDDTLVVVREHQANDKGGDIDKRYERNLQMFKRLVEFTAPADNGTETTS
ncbi:MAG: hypothetical protein FWD71_10325 [Oscillospiraceae bacterium]|nr:hypothetical protein [Oscillospiraceae bacterium]